MQAQLDAMRQFLVQTKAEPAVLSSFDAFESVHAQLAPELQSQWDQQIQALFNAKRANVYVRDKGEPVAVEIRLGVSDGSRSEVIGGLKNGQQVIIGSTRSTP